MGKTFKFIDYFLNFIFYKLKYLLNGIPNTLFIIVTCS